MDNASKALVMAGAILIAVMLISLGVYLFTQSERYAKDGGTQLTLSVITAHNQMVTQYDNGFPLSYSDAIALKNSLDTYNSNSELYSTYGKIKVTGKLEGGKNYDLTYTKYTSGMYSGCIETVNFKEAK